MFRKEIIEVAKKSGSGWVDYKYKNPQSNKIRTENHLPEKGRGHGHLLRSIQVDQTDSRPTSGLLLGRLRTARADSNWQLLPYM